jgi:hypothetical protein
MGGWLEIFAKAAKTANSLRQFNDNRVSKKFLELGSFP